MQEGFSGDKFAPAEHGMAVTARVSLRNEAYAFAQSATGAGIAGFISGANDNAKLLDSSGGSLLQNDLQRWFGFALLVDQHLKR